VRVLVLGAGVIGVSTAYSLALRGHEVTVIDRRDDVGIETSFANGGQISASHTDPWPSPANLIKVLKMIGRQNAPLKFKMTSDPRQYDWCLRFLANCTVSRARINTERMLRVALYSRQKLQDFNRDQNLDYGRRTTGMLHIFRSDKAYREALRQAQIVQQAGCTRNPISAAECVNIEPALATVQQQLVGGFYCPDDESGDAHQFTKNLADLCRSLGVKFKFDISVAALKAAAGSILGIETTTGPIVADAYVMAMGSYSPSITETVGLTLPVYPAKGYSVTLPLSHPPSGPTVSLIDDERKLVYSRLGDNLRIAGTADIGGFDLRIDHRRARHVLEGAMGLLPGCADPDAAEYWAGLRPQTPDSVPVIGRTPIKNLYMNTGHGTLGWTMAIGSAEIVADIVSKKEPEIDMSGLELDRFLQWPKLFFRTAGVSS
jgi:D-amino-acid dehydrogenase